MWWKETAIQNKETKMWRNHSVQDNLANLHENQETKHGNKVPEKERKAFFHNRNLIRTNRGIHLHCREENLHGIELIIGVANS